MTTILDISEQPLKSKHHNKTRNLARKGKTKLTPVSGDSVVN